MALPPTSFHRIIDTFAGLAEEVDLVATHDENYTDNGVIRFFRVGHFDAVLSFHYEAHRGSVSIVAEAPNSPPATVRFDAAQAQSAVETLGSLIVAAVVAAGHGSK